MQRLYLAVPPYDSIESSEETRSPDGEQICSNTSFKSVFLELREQCFWNVRKLLPCFQMRVDVSRPTVVEGAPRAVHFLKDGKKRLNFHMTFIWKILVV